MSDDSERTLVSSLGWVDRGSLWCFEVESGRERRIDIGHAKFLRLHAGVDDLFAAVHFHEGGCVEITAHRFAQPEIILARCVIVSEKSEVHGDVSVWERLPKYYVGYLKQPAWSDFALIEIGGGSVSVQRFDWYDDRYDKGYQAIVDVAQVPGSHLLLVSVQRDSKPVIYDPHAHRKVGEISLAGNYGNPRLYFRRSAPELWADDYDTSLVLEPDSWRVVRQAKLQEAASNTAQFIGQFAFDAHERICALARPYSGDVVGLDAGTLQITSRAEIGKQPLEVAVLRDQRVFVRDWKSGQFSSGSLL